MSFLDGLLLFSMAVLTNMLSTLKTIFIAEKAILPGYIVTFIDGVLFTFSLKQIATGDIFWVTIIYAAGKVTGYFIANLIEEKCAFGILEVTLFLNDGEKMRRTADTLREKGYAVNTSIVHGINGAKRYSIEIIIVRKELDQLYKTLRIMGIPRPTLKIVPVKQIQGKLTAKAYC